MDCEHLFADSDVEETDIATALPCHHHHHHHHLPAAGYVCAPYVPTSVVNSSNYGLPDTLNCMCQTKQEKSNKKTTAVTQMDNLQSRVYLNNYRHRQLCTDKNASGRYEIKCSKPKRSKMMTETQVDNSSVAGPSRLIDSPVNPRYI